ncbi:MAG: hypothetical protein ACPG7F_17395 [Aggregatilineales bacterium]
MKNWFAWLNNLINGSHKRKSHDTTTKKKKRREETGFPKGSLGDTSVRLGYDVRDLYVAGYTHGQIQGVLNGKYTLQELFEMKPAGKPQR